jgi:hypothetical protein
MATFLRVGGCILWNSSFLTPTSLLVCCLPHSPAPSIACTLTMPTPARIHASSYILTFGFCPVWLVCVFSMIVFRSVGKNLLHGTIPNAITRSPNLQFLDLSKNDFVGPLPSELNDILVALYGSFSATVSHSLKSVR